MINKLKGVRKVMYIRVMAVDYGDARTGIAVSDISGFIAGDAFTINEWNEMRIAESIAAEAKQRGAEKIVVGHPLNMDGTTGPRAEKCEKFAELLRGLTDIDVVLWDERRTTVDAHRILSEAGKHGKKRKQTVDAVAATLILEGYLNSLR